MSVYIPGACSVPSCTSTPPKEGNPFCQDHWSRLPGRLRRRLSVIWRSRGRNHHASKITGHDWPRAIAAGVRYFGVLPRNELPRAELAKDQRVIAAHTRDILADATPATEIDPASLDAIRQINNLEERKEPAMTTAYETTKAPDKDGFIHIGKRRYTPEGWAKLMAALKKGTDARKARAVAAREGANGATPARNGRGPRPGTRNVKLMWGGKPNDLVKGLYRDFMLNRYMADEPRPSGEEIFAAGMLAGVERERGKVSR